MPYEGTLDEDAKIPGSQRFWTSTSDNEFQIVRTDLRYIPGYNPDAVISDPSLRQIYEKAAKLYNRQIVKGKVLSQENVVFSGKLALATLYRGFDEYRQRPINIETIWLYHSQALYLLTCSYAVPEETGASEDKKRFFLSFRIDGSPLTKEL
ncbi:hypothetical protein [Hymenobacter sp. DG01]|uniref:hypothetical protein n=1 Tax=Hymenobacter sp. DG01 TaxID=2584940 RepID=UPI001121FF12|nr:hypothetical protein [Hymenobacter sp. DG01]